MIAGLAVALASGCGGSDSSTAAENSPVEVETGQLSKAEFIKRANALCLKSGKQFKIEYFAYTKEHEKDFWVKRAAAIKDLANKVFLPNLEKRVEEIAALGAPAADKSELESYVRAMEGSIQAVRKDPVKATQSLNAVFAKPFQAEQRYGLQGCISGPL